MFGQPPRRSRSSSASVSGSSRSRRSPRAGSSCAGGTRSAGTICEVSLRTSTPDVPAHGGVRGDDADLLPARGARRRAARAACRRPPRSAPRAGRASRPRRARRRRRCRGLPAPRRSSRAGRAAPPASRSRRRAAGCSRRRGRASAQPSRCRRASYSRTAAATLTFSDSTRPSSGIETASVAGPADERAQPLALGAEDECEPAGEVRVPHRRPRLAGGGRDPEVVALDLREVAGEVRHDRDRQVLDGSRGRAADGGGHARRAVRGHDDAGRARALRAAADRAEVARDR